MKKLSADEESPFRTHLSATVYGQLRERLATGQFKPDTRLKIRDLAQELGTSVTPVRDAILQLAGEGALVLRTPRDIRVPILSLSSYLELRKIRMELEGLGSAEAARIITPEALNALEELFHENQLALEEGDYASAMKLNQRFHLGIANAAEMPILKDVIDKLWVRVAPLIAGAYENFTYESRVGHHEVILNAFRNRDSEGARLAIREDILEGSGSMIAYLKQFSFSDI